jgi:membrane fusion protein, multidrug efflux system
MIKRMIIMLVLLAVVAAGFAAYKMHAMHEGMKQMAAGFAPPSVSTVKAESKEWQPRLSAIGTLRAINGADLSSEIAGIVDNIQFESGSDVDKGAILIQLRADDDTARLHALDATAKLAEITLGRDQKQLKAQAVSQATIDTDTANLNSAKAQVDAQQALIDKKTIKAPFAGHVGVRQVDIGQYLNPGSVIVTLQQLDPIYVDFSLPEQALPKVAVGQPVTLHTDAFADQAFSGKVTAINSKVDEATRNVVVRATFDNADHKLLPGMFGNVDVNVEAPAHFITLPQTAVVFNTYGSTVYVVQTDENAPEGKPKTTVQQSVVVTGETRGDQISVLSGVKEGDEIVTSGQVKLRNGMPVTVNNETAPPPNDPDPTPHQQ